MIGHRRISGNYEFLNRCVYAPVRTSPSMVRQMASIRVWKSRFSRGSGIGWRRIASRTLFFQVDLSRETLITSFRSLAFKGNLGECIWLSRRPVTTLISSSECRKKAGSLARLSLYSLPRWFGITDTINYPRNSAASATATDASTSLAPSPRSGGCVRASPRTAGRLLPACGRCSCRCQSACARRVLRAG